MATKFLVPLDGSELAEESLPVARLLAENAKKQVELLRCYEAPAIGQVRSDPITQISVSESENAIDALHQQHSQEYLQGQAQKFREGTATTLRAKGDAAQAILDRSNSGEIEWVIMSSHGRGGLGRWLLGSVALKIL